MSRKISFALSVSLFMLSSSYSVQAVNLFANPSFETPASSAQSVRQIDDSTAGGWRTTHPTGTWCGTTANCRPIEFWSNSFNGVTSGQGAQHIELNATDRSMVFQPISLAGGSKVNWSFLHRGRDVSTTPDVAQLRIGIPGGLPAGSLAPDSYSYHIVTVSTTYNGTFTTPTGSGTINVPAAIGNGWVRYSGTYTYTPAAGTPPVVNIGFVSVSAAGGDTGLGNFVDDVRLDRGNPCCPPWSPDELAQTMFYAGSGGISANYTLTFNPSTVNSQMQAYIEYLNSMNAGTTSIIIAFTLYDQGTGQLPMTLSTSPGNNGTMIGGNYWMNWTANGTTNPSTTPTSPNPNFFPGFPMQVGTWYLVHTGIFLNDGSSFFPDDCANNDIFVRMQVLQRARGSNPTLEIRNKSGEMMRQIELKNNREMRR